ARLRRSRDDRLHPGSRQGEEHGQDPAGPRPRAGRRGTGPGRSVLRPMDSTAHWALEAPELSDRDLSSIARLVYDACGINLHEGKRALVAARLQKRLRHGGFRTFRQYIRYVRTDASGREMTALLDAIATNHTSFFREPRHFEFLAGTVLPPLVERTGPLSIWSAGCSTG